jgi:hypothetical protein
MLIFETGRYWDRDPDKAAVPQFSGFGVEDDIPGRRAIEPDDAPRNRSLAATRLANQRKGLAAPDCEADAVQRLYRDTLLSAQHPFERRRRNTRKSGSQWTLRWREMDSNFRFRASSDYAGVGVLRSTWAV